MLDYSVHRYVCSSCNDERGCQYAMRGDWKPVFQYSAYCTNGNSIFDLNGEFALCFIEAFPTLQQGNMKYSTLSHLSNPYPLSFPSRNGWCRGPPEQPSLFLTYLPWQEAWLFSPLDAPSSLTHDIRPGGFQSYDIIIWGEQRMDWDWKRHVCLLVNCCFFCSCFVWFNWYHQSFCFKSAALVRRFILELLLQLATYVLPSFWNGGDRASSGPAGPLGPD